VRLYGYPDPRGIVLEIREVDLRICPGSRFRSESPDVVAWDDGTVAYRTSTFDYCRTKVSFDKVKEWASVFRNYCLQDMIVACGKGVPAGAPEKRTLLQGIGWGLGSTISVSGLSPAHADLCADCAQLRPLAKMLRDVDEIRNEGAGEALTGLPVEVYLEFRSCGCRNHPDIARASREWPLAGEKPKERCCGLSTRFRLEDPSDIRTLSEAIARSAAVLDRGEIYTCFMRPLLDPPKDRMLARR